MNIALTVPAEMVGHLRNGLHSVIGGAARDISQTTEQPGREHHPESYEEPREHYDRTCALLDLIGWGDPEQPTQAQVDLPTHRWALMEALDVLLLVADADMEEADTVDAERAKRGEAAKREATTRRVLALREFASAAKARVDALDEQGSGEENEQDEGGRFGLVL
ncbi:MAG TPA: hypothetical protein VIJ66_04440 [Solirubrobacteraceae bacterium]